MCLEGIGSSTIRGAKMAGVLTKKNNKSLIPYWLEKIKTPKVRIQRHSYSRTINTTKLKCLKITVLNFLVK